MISENEIIVSSLVINSVQRRPENSSSTSDQMRVLSLIFAVIILVFSYASHM